MISFAYPRQLDTHPRTPSLKGAEYFARDPQPQSGMPGSGVVFGVDADVSVAEIAGEDARCIAFAEPQIKDHVVRLQGGRDAFRVERCGSSVLEKQVGLAAGDDMENGLLG